MRSVRLMTCIKHISTAVCRRTKCIKYLKKKTLFFTNFFEILRHETLFYLFLLVLFTKSSYFKIKTHTIYYICTHSHTLSSTHLLPLHPSPPSTQCVPLIVFFSVFSLLLKFLTHNDRMINDRPHQKPQNTFRIITMLTIDTTIAIIVV